MKPTPLWTRSFDARDKAVDNLGMTDYFLLKKGAVDLEPFRHKSVVPKHSQDSQNKEKKKKNAKKETEPDLIAQYLEHKYQTVKDFVAKRSLLRQNKNRSLREPAEISAEKSMENMSLGDQLQANKLKQSQLMAKIREQMATDREQKLIRADTFGNQKSADS